MSARILLCVLDAVPPAAGQAQAWRDKQLVPALARTSAGVRCYCAFNSTQLAVVAPTAEGAAHAALPDAPRGLALRRFDALQTFEMQQTGGVDPLSASLLYSVRFRVPGEWFDEFDRWYDEEHLPMIYGNRNWSMSRRYRLTPGAPDGATHLALHYLADARGLDAPELKASRLTPWRKKFLGQPWFTDADKMIYFVQAPADETR